ncbi:hypothetical protein, partial [Metapseudomonas otitidis]|uniref:hypothetical protein n=1 Tax=Metapseudomonas otitidis TaxID=319939 RepID=UPI00244C510F
MSDLDHGPMYCMGRNCGTTTAQHSPECILETAIIQGWSTEATLAAAKAVFDASATLSPAHIEDGEEVEVVGYRVSMPGEPELGTWLDEAAEEEPQIQRHEPLMTVAQHQRIVAGLQSEIAKLGLELKDSDEYGEREELRANRYSSELVELRAALSAPPAAGVPEGWSIQREFSPNGYAIQMPSGGFLRITETGGGGVETAFCQLISAMLAAAPTPPASEQQRAVVMPERLTFNPDDMAGFNEIWVNARNTT